MDCGCGVRPHSHWGSEPTGVPRFASTPMQLAPDVTTDVTFDLGTSCHLPTSTPLDLLVNVAGSSPAVLVVNAPGSAPAWDLWLFGPAFGGAALVALIALIWLAQSDTHEWKGLSEPLKYLDKSWSFTDSWAADDHRRCAGDGSLCKLEHPAGCFGVRFFFGVDRHARRRRCCGRFGRSRRRL